MVSCHTEEMLGRSVGYQIVIVLMHKGTSYFAKVFTSINMASGSKSMPSELQPFAQLRLVSLRARKVPAYVLYHEL